MNDARRIHFVGSLPKDLDTPTKVMEFARNTAGEHFDGIVPGGEAEADRAQWYVRPIVERFADHPALEPVHRGDWSTMKERTVHRLRAGHSLREADIDKKLGYFTEALMARAAFQTFQDTNPGVRYQAGIPSPLTLAFVAFDQQALIPYRRSVPRAEAIWPYCRPLVEATIREIVRIHDAMGDDIVFQLELTGETYLCTKTPFGSRSLVADIIARAISNLVAHAPDNARFGVHLCHGSMNNTPEVIPSSTAGVVTLANAIARRWPQGRHLEFVHLPMAYGERPPMVPTYYSALGHLKLPSDTRVVAGMSHPHQPLTDQRQALVLIEGAVGRRVDLAAPCGLGRYPDAAAAHKAVEHAITLAAG